MLLMASWVAWALPPVPPHVVDPERNGPALRRTGEVVLVHLIRLPPPRSPVIPKVADQFLFLGIDADDRPPGRFELGPAVSDVPELFVAVGVTANRELQRRNDQLAHRLDLLLKRVYGPRADQLNPNQPSLFDEPDDPPVSLPPPSSEPAVITTMVKTGHGRQKLPRNLKRQIEVIDVPEAVKQATGGEWVKIGEEVSEKLDYTPSSLFVRQIVRPKYVVRLARYLGVSRARVTQVLKRLTKPRIARTSRNTDK
jgi:hypothetical protein